MLSNMVWTGYLIRFRLNLRVGQIQIVVYKTALALNLSYLSKWFHYINPALTSNLLTCVIWNLHPLDVTKPCSFNRQVISNNDLPCIDSAVTVLSLSWDSDRFLKTHSKLVNLLMVVSYGFGEFGELFYSNACSFHSIQVRSTSIVKDEQK